MTLICLFKVVMKISEVNCLSRADFFLPQSSRKSYKKLAVGFFVFHLGIKYRPCLFQQLEKDCMRLNNERNKKLCHLCSLSGCFE